jgi:hypothetical protein
MAKLTGPANVYKRFIHDSHRVPLVGADVNDQGVVKPKGRFWKRWFNKRVRKGHKHKRGNWIELN